MRLLYYSPSPYLIISCSNSDIVLLRSLHIMMGLSKCWLWWCVDGRRCCCAITSSIISQAHSPRYVVHFLRHKQNLTIFSWPSRQFLQPFTVTPIIIIDSSVDWFSVCVVMQNLDFWVPQTVVGSCDPVVYQNAWERINPTVRPNQIQ